MTAATEDDVSTRGLLLYGVVRAEAELPPLADRATHPVRGVPHGDVVAVVGSVELERPAVSTADLTAYHSVLDALAASGPVVPVRFGSVMLDEESLVEQVLRPRADEFCALLDALEGRSQLTVRARYVEEVVLREIVASDPRIRELNDRTRGVPEEESWADRVRLGELVAHALEERREHDAAALLERVVPLAVELRERSGAGADHLLEVAVLVDDDRSGQLEDALETYAEAARDRVRVSLIGPLAPYDFVGGG